MKNRLKKTIATKEANFTNKFVVQLQCTVQFICISPQVALAVIKPKYPKYILSLHANFTACPFSTSTNTKMGSYQSIKHETLVIQVRQVIIHHHFMPEFLLCSFTSFTFIQTVSPPNACPLFTDFVLLYCLLQCFQSFQSLIIMKAMWCT